MIVNQNMAKQLIFLVLCALLISSGASKDGKLIKDGAELYYEREHDNHTERVYFEVGEDKRTEVNQLLRQHKHSLEEVGGVEELTETSSFDDEQGTCCELCRVTKRQKPIIIVKNNQSFVMVSGEKYHASQNITYNVCDPVQEEDTCGNKETPKDMTEYTCQQKFTVMNLLCFNLQEKKFEALLLTYPSSCDYTIKKDGWID